MTRPPRASIMNDRPALITAAEKIGICYASRAAKLTHITYITYGTHSVSKAAANKNFMIRIRKEGIFKQAPLRASGRHLSCQRRN